MHSNTMLEPEMVANRKLRLFTLYADFPAGVRAKRLSGQITRLAGKDWEPSVEMWKLDAVSPIGHIKDMIAQEAGEADVLLIASSASAQPDPATIRWLNSLAGWKAKRPVSGLLIGLLGDEERAAGATDWMVTELALFARRTQMDFVWHRAEHGALDHGDWLAAGVENLLARKRSASARPPAPQLPPDGASVQPRGSAAAK